MAGVTPEFETRSLGEISLSESSEKGNGIIDHWKSLATVLHVYREIDLLNKMVLFSIIFYETPEAILAPGAHQQPLHIDSVLNCKIKQLSSIFLTVMYISNPHVHPFEERVKKEPKKRK